MPSLTTSEHALYATTLITAVAVGGESTGTGFFYAIILDHKSGDAIPLLITNKHVVEGATDLFLHVHLAKSDSSAEPSGEVAAIKLSLGEGGVILHPDPDVDLCAVLVAPILNHSKDQGRDVFFRYFVNKNIPKAEDWNKFDALEEVIMVGCPRGIYDSVNHNPIMRSGITATPLNRMYQGKNEFMVDMACFPGSSGSPVLLMDHVGHHDREKNTFMFGARRFFLLGILYQGPLITNQGQIILGRTPSVQTATMMHLGNVIRSSELLVLEEEIKRRGV